MKFTELAIEGMFLIEQEPVRDERGYFVKTLDADAFFEHGLNTMIEQINTSYNIKAGTIRGLHYQISPYDEAKITSVIRGSIFDVALDMRQESMTYGKAVGVVMHENSFSSLYVPEGCAHGYQALENGTTYQFMSTCRYNPKAERRIKWNKVPSIQWPILPPIVSVKDNEET